VSEQLSAEVIKAGLDTQFAGQNVVYWPQIGSTNDEAKRLAQNGAPEGTLVIADHQTSGRGRLDRRWESPPGSSLLMSLLFRPELAPRQAQRLTMICGLAVLDAVEQETGLRLGLKWPNDVLVNGAKVAGILTELGLSGDQVDYVVVGIGLNVNLEPTQLPGDLLMPATSLSEASGREVARLPLLQAFLLAVEGRYQSLKSGLSPYAEWAERLVTLQKPVTVSDADGEMIEGVAEAVDADGALLVRLADDQMRAVLAGDVTLRR